MEDAPIINIVFVRNEVTAKMGYKNSFPVIFLFNRVKIILLTDEDQFVKTTIMFILFATFFLKVSKKIITYKCTATTLRFAGVVLFSNICNAKLL